MHAAPVVIRGIKKNINHTTAEQSTKVKKLIVISFQLKRTLLITESSSNENKKATTTRCLGAEVVRISKMDNTTVLNTVK